MGTHVIKKGLDIPLAGGPDQGVLEEKRVHTAGVAAADYPGLRTTFFVQAGDAVKRGQPLFEDKRNPGVLHTAPGAGVVAGINRGDRRALISVTITLSDGERSGNPGADEFHPFAAFTGAQPASLNRAQAVELLRESGLWPALRTRPFSKTPPLSDTPRSIFVTAMDSNPLAPDLDKVGEGRQEDLDAGLALVAKLTEGPVFFCKKAGSRIAPKGADARVRVEEFSGPHPSGLAGTHIGLLDPAGKGRTVWTVGLQDLLSMGALARTGRLDTARVVSLAGPQVKKPRLIRTRLGASLSELTAGELADGENRVISGSALSGRQMLGETDGLLGRFHNQVTVLAEGRAREFMGWLAPGAGKYSALRMFLSKLRPGALFPMTTSTNGDRRAMVPIGLYERVMPLDILPTFLLRSLWVGDVEKAEALGCLELDEEDLALCTFVSPGKEDFGPVLREVLEVIQKEG